MQGKIIIFNITITVIMLSIMFVCNMFCIPQVISDNNILNSLCDVSLDNYEKSHDELLLTMTQLTLTVDSFNNTLRCSIDGKGD